MRKQNGFTIIEVSLVLAIAGLIFTMVFIALPALWRSERDSERKSDMLSFVQNLKNFQSNNNRGALPTLSSSDEQILKNGGFVDISGSSITPSADVKGTSWEDFYKSFFDSSFSDPDGERYNLVITNCGTTAYDADCSAKALSASGSRGGLESFNYNIYVVLSATCNGEKSKYSASPRNVAVLYRTESNGIYCTNS